ncbi:MAG: 50S ribosomal protein L2 [Myxococcales bacterium]|nr:50S ribosomal protein L2 [Myxococcales bacterium]USN50893.1 MAG: 50S ribosomal protein L2 [Myxococcales bacterium]
MAIIVYKPTSAGRRNSSINRDTTLSKKKPEKNLVRGKKAISGRGSNGRINVRFRGGAHKRKLREVDFVRSKTGIAAKVVAFEYDPNRSANLALIQYLDGVKSYILAPNNLKIGDTVVSGPASEVRVGNHLPLKNIPLGLEIHNIELKPLKGGQLVRSAGVVAQLLAKEGDYVTIRMPSGEMRYIHGNCSATIGQVGNVGHELRKIGKAGKKRWLGFRPHNRGVAMNPVDHPLGGGEGKSSGGRHPVSPWGQPTKGHRTRNNKRTANMIIKRRKK